MYICPCLPKANKDDFKARRSRRQDDQLIVREGRRVLWERAVLSPSRNDVTGRIDYTGTQHDGRGYRYRDPQEISAILTSDSRETGDKSPGMIETGTCRATLSCQYDIGDQDRLTDLTTWVRRQLMIERAATGSDDLIRSPHTGGVTWLEDAAGERYEPDAHFTLYRDANGHTWVRWLTPDRPASGQSYSAHLQCRPVWIVQGHPTDRYLKGGRGVQLPWEVQLALDDPATRAASQLSLTP